ncbi:MAG: SMI1/KNR4 family protein [Myxococcota bacterium]|nr:SMI1/KNR4 family protein [Myxococcota bacterium]
MTIPARCARVVAHGEPLDAGPGETLYTLQINGTLKIEGAASLETLREAVESGFFDQVSWIAVDRDAQLERFPENLGRLPLEGMSIGSDRFTGWDTLAALPIASLFLEEWVSRLGEGLGANTSLRELRLQSAKNLTELPSDFRQLKLTRVTFHKGQIDALRAHLEHMPSLVAATVAGAGVRLQGGQLSIGNPTGNHRALWRDWHGHERALELAFDGFGEPVTRLVLEPQSTLPALPAPSRLPDVEAVVVHSGALDDWSSVFRLGSLKSLVVDKKASGSLEGISALTKLETLIVKAKGVTELPAEIAGMRSLETIEVSPALRPALEPMSDARTALALEAVLERLERALAQTAPDYLASLAPGVDDAALDAVEAELGVSLPATVRALYRWRDGHLKQDGRFVYLRSFESLASAASTWKMLREMERAGEWARDGEQPPGVWSDRWFPFARWSNGLHLCVDLEGTYRGRRGQVLEVWMKDSDRQIVAPDLTAWLDVFVRALEDGSIRETAGGDLHWDRPPAYAAMRGYPVRKTSRQAP